MNLEKTDEQHRGEGDSMTIPEYDEDCTCGLCVTIRNERNNQYKQRIKEKIDKILKNRKTSTGNNLLEDSFR